MLRKILQLIVVMLIATQGVMAQTVQIESVIKPPGEIQVPVNMTGFTDVAAITLSINYDPAVMSFNGIDSTAISGSWLTNAENGVIKITYTTSNAGVGYNINGKAFNLIFSYKGGFDGELVFEETECEIVDKNLAEISASYLNGSVLQVPAIGLISLPTINDAVAGSAISLPVSISTIGTGTPDLSSVSAITLILEYQDCTFDLTGISSGLLSGVTYNYNNSSGMLEIMWTGSTGVNLTAGGTLFTLNFNFNGGAYGEIEFEGGCEVKTSSLEWVAMDYTPGAVWETNTLGSNDTLNLHVATHYFGESILYTDPLDTTSNKVIIGVPVISNGLDTVNIGSIDLNILYTQNLDYKGYSAEQLSGWTVNSEGEYLNFKWSNANGASLANDTVLLLKFEYDTTSGDAYVGFDCGSYIYDKDLQPVNAVLAYGAVLSSPAAPPAYAVSGQLTYVGGTKPIGSNSSVTTTVYLKNTADSTIAYTTVADTNGNFEFLNVAIGDYFLDASTTIDATYSYNATDAYIIYGIGSTLTGLKALAADVNMAGGVNVTDAYIVYGSWRAGNVKVVAWKAPDWIFENPVVNVTNADVVQNFSGICSGDANGSFTPMP